VTFGSFYMSNYLIDIIIPVWNRPVETRATLASFVASSPEARLVIVNHGSERETESILDEFAEALDDRVILVATERNIGTVAAINLGLKHADAPYLLLASTATRLSSGWGAAVTAHFASHGDAGAITLQSGHGGLLEADCGSFSAMVLKRELLQAIDGFDESLDGAVWALRDFTRRAHQAGFCTYSCGCPQLRLEALPELGSHAGREERMRAAGRLYAGRWGAPCSYLLFYDDIVSGSDAATIMAVLLQAARRGHRITVVTGRKNGRELSQAGLARLHENIVMKALPLLFPKKAVKSIIAAEQQLDGGTILIDNGTAGDCAMNRVSFDAFAAKEN
jgi:glycosyltransferase involved in cell wall biosynthesis